MQQRRYGRGGKLGIVLALRDNNYSAPVGTVGVLTAYNGTEGILHRTYIGIKCSERRSGLLRRIGKHLSRIAICHLTILNSVRLCSRISAAHIGKIYSCGQNGTNPSIYHIFYTYTLVLSIARAHIGKKYEHVFGLFSSL